MCLVKLQIFSVETDAKDCLIAGIGEALGEQLVDF